jgi:hypothetical protein
MSCKNSCNPYLCRILVKERLVEELQLIYFIILNNILGETSNSSISQQRIKPLNLQLISYV